MAVPVAKGKPIVPTEAAWQKYCPSRGRSLPPIMRAESTSRDITQLLSSKNVAIYYCTGKKPTSSFSLVTFNQKVKKAFKGAWLGLIMV